MLNSMFFLPCVSFIICVIIVCITFIAYKRHSNNTEDNTEISEPYYPNDFIRLGNNYINIYDIECIYLDDENRRVTIDTERSQYEWDFDDDSEYYQYINHLNNILNIR